jgi:hypothetical protein
MHQRPVLPQTKLKQRRGEHLQLAPQRAPTD